LLRRLQFATRLSASVMTRKLLRRLRQCLEGSDAEKRLAELERVLTERGNLVPFKPSG
jgi:hypothetical protein